MHLYLIKVFLFFILPAVPGYVFFSRFFNYEENNSLKPLIYALGISPVFSLLVLYYSMLIFKGLHPFFYVFIFYFSPYLLFIIKLNTIRLHFPDWKYLAGIISFFVLVFFYASRKALTEHDTLEYALQGKHFFNYLSVYYTSFPFHEENGFYYIGLHGFAFPLIYTWELMINQLFHSDSILLFKAVNSVYALLLLLLVFTELRKFGLKYAIAATFILALTSGFIFNALQFHLEMIRQFLFLAFVMFFINALTQHFFSALLVFSAIAGLQSTIHSIGAIAAAIALAIVILKLFITNSDKKLYHSLLATVFLIVFGWIHYILDILIGTGWILK